ncbi:hypothetical protein HZS_3703 [Henneguya salminicola]|nr:hypothetical protein HZS_3703 [Henneguya salminicola]
MFLLFFIFNLCYSTHQRISIIQNLEIIADFEEIEVFTDYYQPIMFTVLYKYTIQGPLINGQSNCVKFPVIKKILPQNCFILIWPNSSCSAYSQIGNAARMGYQAVIYVDLLNNRQHSERLSNSQQNDKFFVALVSHVIFKAIFCRNMVNFLPTIHTLMGIIIIWYSRCEINLNERRGEITFRLIPILLILLGIGILIIISCCLHVIRFCMKRIKKILARRHIYQIPSRTVATSK